MKNYFIIFFLFASLSVRVFAQIPYYDAKDIIHFIDPLKKIDGAFKLPENDELYKILKLYSINTATTKDDIINSFKGNPFITFEEGKSASNISIIAKAKEIIPSIQGLNVTNISNAIASIMIDHAKQELTIAFFNRFKSFAEKNPEFKVLFPKTTNNLANLLAYKYPEMLPALRTGFFNDLNQITYHLDDVLELPRYEQLLKNNPEIKVAIRSIKLIQRIESGELNAASAITYISDYQEWKDKDNPSYSNSFKNMGNAIKLAEIFSQSLRDKNGTSIWISPNEATALLSNDDLFQIYLGLIYQEVKLKDIKFYIEKDGSSINFTQNMNNNVNNILAFQNKVENFILLSSRFETAYQQLKTNKDHNNEDYYNYINVSINIIDSLFSIAEKYKANTFMHIARQLNDLYRDIYNKQYCQAVIDGTNILLNINTIAQSSKDDNEFNKRIRFIEDVRPYALFMANVAEAQTSEDIKSALENVILPVGSSAIKKNSNFNLSIQSYLGGYYQLKKSSFNYSSWNDQWGINGLIGIAISYGFEKWGSISLFGSLFDLGAIIDYKLTRDSVLNSNGQQSIEVKKENQIKLGQIISPGIFLVYGLFCNIPLSIGIGTQYGPGLNKIESNGNVIVNNPKWRPSVFISVDIPLITFKNYPKGYKLKR